MKIIFVDIDGVLVTWDSLHRWSKFGHKGAMMEPECSKILNEILEETGASIVVSSSWRIGRTMEQLEKELSEGGVNTATLIDKTPRRQDSKRGLEIQEWLRNQAFVTLNPIDKFVILDDEISDMDPLKHLVVQTSMEKGLTKEHKEQIIKMLK